MTSVDAPKPARSLDYFALHPDVFVSIVASVKPKGTIRSIIVATSSDAGNQRLWCLRERSIPYVLALGWISYPYGM